MSFLFFFFFFNDPPPTEIYTLSLHDALPISRLSDRGSAGAPQGGRRRRPRDPGGRLLRAAGSRVPGPAGSPVPGAGGRRLPLYPSPGSLLRAGGLLRRLGPSRRRVLLLADQGDRRGAGAGVELFQPPGAGPAAGAVRVL